MRVIPKRDICHTTLLVPETAPVEIDRNVWQTPYVCEVCASRYFYEYPSGAWYFSQKKAAA